MRYRIDEIKLTAEEYADEAKRIEHIRTKALAKIAKHVQDAGDSGRIEILRESIDARKKPDVMAVFSVCIETDRKLPLKEVKETEDPLSGLPTYDIKRPRPVIAGFGPCGMFAALTLALRGANPIIIERGKPVDERVRDVERFWQEGALDTESNVQFGEGGAGTFSDGKLTTGVKDERKKWVLERFVEAGADGDILYKSKPHIGTDRLRMIIPRIRERIIELGGEVRFCTRLDGIRTQDGKLTGLIVSEPAKQRSYEIETEDLILATGHSAEDTMRMLLEEGMEMSPKPFSIGVRIEHPQEDINRAQYGDPDLAEIFGPAEYKLNHRCENGRGVYTFCMCPGGRVINAASAAGRALTNGMSDHDRAGEYANSGLLVDVRIEDFYDGTDPMSGVAFQQEYEKRAGELAKGNAGEDDTGPAALPQTTYGRFRDEEGDHVRSCLPGFAAESIVEAMPHLGRKLVGFDSDGAKMTAVETRSSSPVRIKRDDRLQSSIPGIIPAGEGPGYAGGIMSSAIDGMRAAEAVLRK